MLPIGLSRQVRRSFEELAVALRRKGSVDGRTHERREVAVGEGMKIADRSIAETVGTAFVVARITEADFSANVVDEEGSCGNAGGDGWGVMDGLMIVRCRRRHVLR